MIAATDRSMPAVRMISVWAMPRMPMIVTLDDQGHVERREEIVGDGAKGQHAHDQHDDWYRRRMRVEEMLDMLERAALRLVELGDLGAAVA
jgi:hypothetical protein